MHAAATASLAVVALGLTACGGDEQQLAENARCAAVHGRMSVLLKEKANGTMAGEERKIAAGKLMDMSVGYFKKATEAGSKEEATKKMGEYTKAQGELFKKDPDAFGDYLLAEANTCKPLETATEE